MTTHTTALSARLRALTDRPDTDALARLAAALLGDPSGTSRLSIGELSSRVGVSESSVVRTAKALGLTGYRELRVAMAELGTRALADVPQSGVADIALADSTADVVAKLAAEEARTIRETAALLDVETLDQAADAVIAARRVDIVGVVASGLVAQDCALKLARIGLNARAHTDGHIARQTAVLLGPSDVLIAISHSGFTDDVIAPLELAAEQGATTVAVTSNPRSATATVADLRLITSPSREAGIRPGAISSRTAQLFAIDALFVAILQRLDPDARASLTASFDAVRSLKRGAARTHRTTPNSRPSRT